MLHNPKKILTVHFLVLIRQQGLILFQGSNDDGSQSKRIIAFGLKNYYPTIFIGREKGNYKM